MGRRAPDGMVLAGINATLPLHQAMMGAPEFRDGDYTIHWLERFVADRNSDAVAVVHDVALGLAEAGVMAKRRLRDFDAVCLTPVEPLSPSEIRALRLRENAFQAVFALHLNVTTGLVGQWARASQRHLGSVASAIPSSRANGRSATAFGARSRFNTAARCSGE